MAAAASEAEKNGEVNFIPDRFSKIYQNWLNKYPRLVYFPSALVGSSYPGYTCDDCGEITVVRGGMPEKCPKCGSTHLTQDPDTLDTWLAQHCGRSPR